MNGQAVGSQPLGGGGLRKLAGETGGFHLWPAAEADPTGDRLKEAKVEPADAEQLLPV